MSTAQQLAVPEPESLSWAEICARWPDQFVCLVDIQRADGDAFFPEIVSARVIGHGPMDKIAFEPSAVVSGRYTTFAIQSTAGCTEALVRPALILDDEALEIIREPLTIIWRDNDDETRELIHP